MEKIAVFVDDADYARRMLAPMFAPGAGAVYWVVVACAPRLTHRIGKWTAHSSREQWRERWARSLRQEIEPLFGSEGGSGREWILARGPLDRLTAKLRARLGSDLPILDGRRPKLGVAAGPLCPEQPAAQSRWTTPVAVSSSLALMLALTD